MALGYEIRKPRVVGSDEQLFINESSLRITYLSVYVDFFRYDGKKEGKGSKPQH